MEAQYIPDVLGVGAGPDGRLALVVEVGVDADSGLMNIIRNSPATDWAPDWGAISVPTLIITGHCDRVFRDPEVIDRISARIADHQREEWEDCGHMVPVERPARLAESLANFGAEIEGART